MREVSIIDQYSKEELINFVKNNTSFCEILNNMGYARKESYSINRLKAKLDLLEIDYSHLKGNNNHSSSSKRTEEEVFCENSLVAQKTLVNHYKNKIKPNFCSICGQNDEWNNKKLVLILDHINGICNDNRIENLRWVCPNCNSQLNTTGGANKQSKCIDCSKVIQKGTLRCEDCNKKWLEKINYNNDYCNGIPERNKLKKMIRENTFSKIYSIFGIQHQRLRTWNKNYNLPVTKKEINSYSDEEWNEL